MTDTEDTRDVTEEEEEEEEEEEKEEFDPTITTALLVDNEIIEIDDRYASSNAVSEVHGKREYVIFPNSKEAGEDAREHWKDMAHHDPLELRAIIGDETLISWALGVAAGPGYTRVSSLKEWLDLWLDIPEEHFATYDGKENDCMVSLALANNMGWDTGEAAEEVKMNNLPLFYAAPSKKPNVGWVSAVAYRTN